MPTRLGESSAPRVVRGKTPFEPVSQARFWGIRGSGECPGFPGTLPQRIRANIT